jgi:hypothetical protein
MLETKLIPVKTAAPLSTQTFDSAAAGPRVDSSITKIIPSTDKTRQMTFMAPLPYEDRSGGSLTVYALDIPFAIYFSDSYGFVMLT